MKQAHPGIRSAAPWGQIYSSWTQRDWWLFPLSTLVEIPFFQVFAYACVPSWNAPPCVSPAPMSAHENPVFNAHLHLCLFHNVLFAPLLPRFVWLCLWAPSGCTSYAALSEPILNLVVTLSSCFILLCLTPIIVEVFQGQDLWFIYSCVPRDSMNVYWWCNNQTS